MKGGLERDIQKMCSTSEFVVKLRRPVKALEKAGVYFES
jgi:hypothetical protein